MEHKAGIIASVDSLLLKEDPIPTASILSGRPLARSGHHSASPDGGASTNVWDCTAGSFRWHYRWDETVIILEGSVKVTSPAAVSSQLEPGDVALFPAGTTWTWEVDRYVRKLAFHRQPASKVDRTVRKLREKLGSPIMAIRLAITMAAAIAASMAALYALE